MAVPLSRVLVAALLAGSLGRRGLKKQSLDVSGAAAACFVGFFTLASGYRFGLLLLGFYFSGSKLTKVRASVKQQLDANWPRHSSKHNEPPKQPISSVVHTSAVDSDWTSVQFPLVAGL
ncbi:Integral membrane protein DUF92 [Phytophthora infestans]|uniref:Integral membrane protein DUF92 n=1 Tax=Phytophthora infestans TaxID=4787 RepID=A0A833SJQ7_PHYIN|nr:Integral membrane protein DUF92 [Phytophthora infestans]KAF4131505.1 Integral membrane protein DUF92 [Phytophthora infestans]